MRNLIRSGQARRLLIGAGGVMVLISALLVLERTLTRSSFFVVLFIGTLLSVYLIHRGR
jgi:hypothetical protein